uniref:non-specific serine/threonine protein kinase n=1 Tax=Gossypium raimondii TaxID=29730 RepID=A0A0D2P228_GOSRA|nr:hypothetical protein B456_003G154000 [Gossypium raimondii]
MGNCWCKWEPTIYKNPKSESPKEQERERREGTKLPSNPEEVEDLRGGDSAANPLIAFTFEELKIITANFRQDRVLGGGGFGNVYKGFIPEDLREGLQIQPLPLPVAVKVHDGDNSYQGHREWLAEVIFLGQLSHPNLVKLIGYCCQDDHRDYNAKLSDFGLAKDGPEGDKSHVSTRIMGTYGYAAPEYIMTGHLSPRSDVYSFGVVLLELLTGRKSLDKSRPAREQNLTDWALPLLKEKKKLLNIVDPRLQGDFPIKAFHKAAMLAYHCLNRNPKARPLMRDIVDSLDPLQLSHPLPIEKTIVTVSTEAASYSFVAYMDESSEHIVCGKPYNGIQ